MSFPEVHKSSFDLTEDLNKLIEELHENFIKEDSPEKKHDAWNGLQENARKYLCLVPQNRKFKFNETERVLNQSANSRGDFDPREACHAFESLAKYAHNLLKQPWRQEFHTIQLTSGYYVHNVAAHLKNAQEILIAMGYVNISDKSLKLVPNYDPSTIKAVSKDCILACQECVILSHIWKKVSFQEPDYPFTTDLVYEFRNKTKGDVNEACKIILEDVRSKRIPINHQMETGKASPFASDCPNEAGDSVKNSGNINEIGSNPSKMESDDHFYDAVSPGDLSKILFSPTTRRSKSMTFSTSTPKQMSFNKSRHSEKFFSAEGDDDDDMLDGAMSCPLEPEAEHSYSNVPSTHRDKNSLNKSSLNREKTKWHTPMKYKLQPPGQHLKFSKVNERELSYLMKENDAEDMKMELRKVGNINQKGDKNRKLEAYDSTTFPRVRESSRTVSNEDASSKGPNRTVTADVPYIQESDSRKAKPSVSNESNSQVILKSNGRDNVIVPEQIKSSNSESYVDVDFGYKKYGSGASSTDVSSWDMKLKQDIGRRRNGTGDHYYDEPCNIESPPNPKTIPFVKDRCSKPNSSFGLCQNDDTVYYDDPNDSIGFGFVESPRNLSQNQKYTRGTANNTTFFTCDDSFKSLVEEEPSSIAKKEPKLDDLEDVWFHTLLKKEESFNYLESKYEEPMSDLEYFSDKNQTQTGIFSKAKSNSKYFPSTKDTASSPFDIYDRRLLVTKSGDMDYNKPSTSTSGKLDDSIINANLYNKVNKVTQTSKGTIGSSFPKGTAASVRRHLPMSYSDAVRRFDSWDCKHCTYNNTQDEYICEICSKSRDYVDEDHDVIEGVESLLPKLYSLPEYIKGENIDEMINPPKVSKKTCPRCTLINASSARLCEACGFRLKEFNSPSKTTWLEDMSRGAHE